MAIDRVKFPDNTYADIYDSRISGVDSTPTSGSSNVVTSGGLYTALITPKIASEAYEGFASTSTYSVHCLLSWRPTDWDKIYTIHFRVKAWIPNVSSSVAVSDITFQLYQGVVKSYYIENAIASTDYRPYYNFYFYGLTASGFSAGASEFGGVYINADNTYSYTTKRQIVVELIHADGCTVTIFNPDKNSSEAKGSYTTSSYYRSSAKYNTYTAGLQETGDSNSTYSNASLGQGYGTCETAAATTEKAVTLSNYALTTGGVIAVKFTYDVPASATLNINSKGAKAIYYRGSAITADVIKAGDIATFIYSTYYYLIGIDRPKQDVLVSGTNIKTINNTSLLGSGNINIDVTDAIKQGNFILNSNVTSPTSATKSDIFINNINDRIYAAMQRFTVTHKVYNSTNDSFLRDLSVDVFKGNIEQYAGTVVNGEYAVLYIGTEPESTLNSNSSYIWLYGGEKMFLTFYTNRYPEAVAEAKVYFKSSTVTWTSCTITKIANAVYRIDIPSTNYPVAIKIKYYGPSTGSAALSDVKAFSGRSTLITESLVTKYPIDQNLYGNLTVPKLTIRGGTSSQFLKANGTLDNNTYLTSSTGELSTNKVTSLSSSSTDTQYPSAKCVYDLIGDVESVLDEIINGSNNS